MAEAEFPASAQEQSSFKHSNHLNSSSVSKLCATVPDCRAASPGTEVQNNTTISTSDSEKSRNISTQAPYSGSRSNERALQRTETPEFTSPARKPADHTPPRALEAKRPENIIIPRSLQVPLRTSSVITSELTREGSNKDQLESKNEQSNALKSQGPTVGSFQSKVSPSFNHKPSLGENYATFGQNTWCAASPQGPQGTPSVQSSQSNAWQYTTNPNTAFKNIPGHLNLPATPVSGSDGASQVKEPATIQGSDSTCTKKEFASHQTSFQSQQSPHLDNNAQYQQVHYPAMVNSPYGQGSGLQWQLQFPGVVNPLVPSPGIPSHSPSQVAPVSSPHHPMIGSVPGIPPYAYPPLYSPHPMIQGFHGYPQYASFPPGAAFSPHSSFPPNSAFSPSSAYPPNSAYPPSSAYPPNSAFSSSFPFAPSSAYPPNSAVSSSSSYNSNDSITPTSGAASTHMTQAPHMGQLGQLAKIEESVSTVPQPAKSNEMDSAMDSTPSNSANSEPKSLLSEQPSQLEPATQAKVGNTESKQPQHERNNQAMLELMVKISQIKSGPQNQPIKNSEHDREDNFAKGVIKSDQGAEQLTSKSGFFSYDEQGKVLPPPSLPLQCTPKRVAKQQKKRPRLKSEAKGPKIPRRDRYWLDQQANLVCKLEERGFNAIQRETATELKFVCSLCYKGFDTKLLCIRHAVEHLDFKPFRCNDCDMEFTRCDTLQRHLKGRCLGPQARLTFDGKSGKNCPENSDKLDETDGRLDKYKGAVTGQGFGESNEFLRRVTGGGRRVVSQIPQNIPKVEDNSNTNDSKAGGRRRGTESESESDSNSESESDGDSDSSDSESEQGEVLNGSKFGLLSMVPPVVKPGEIPAPVKPPIGTGEPRETRSMDISGTRMLNSGDRYSTKNRSDTIVSAFEEEKSFANQYSVSRVPQPVMPLPPVQPKSDRIS